MKLVFNTFPINLLTRGWLPFTAALLSLSQPAYGEGLDIYDEFQAEMTENSEMLQHAALYSGYRFISPDGGAQAAAPYMRLKSGASGGFSAGTVGSDLKLLAEGRLLHSDDYNAILMLDYSGLYRLKVDSSSLWHNLERSAAVTAPSVITREMDSGSNYGLRTTISRVDNRIKLGNNPIHFNINYWQLAREGSSQLRFSDYGFEGKPNSAVTRSIRADNITREGTVGLDTHAGPVNAAYSFTIRDFSNQAPDNLYQFAARDSLAHDVINDSRLVSHTFKLYSDLSGGLTANTLYSISQRETSTDRGSARPSSNPSDTLQTVAGEVSYTPVKELLLSLKYRRLQIDRETPASVSSPLLVAPAATTMLVRPSSSSLKDTVILSASYRPILKAVYRFEYRAELESRDGLPDYQTPVSASVNDRRQTHTGKASFIWKPVNGINLNASYSYAASDAPAYTSSFSERHVGTALISYTSKSRWGVTANYQGRFESSESNYQQTQLPRDSRSNSASSSIWLSPTERVTVNAGYTFQQTKVDQSSIFYNKFAFYNSLPMIQVLTSGSYRSRAHVYYLDTVIAVTKMLDLSLALQQAFSDISFSASDNSTIANLSASGIGSPSRLVSTSTSLTGRADLRLSKHLGGSLGYSFRTFNSGVSSLDGAVHETILAMTGRW